MKNGTAFSKSSLCFWTNILVFIILTFATPALSIAATLLPPTLVSPGTGTEPGQTVPTTTPAFQWQSVSGAIGSPITGISYSLPGGYLVEGGQFQCVPPTLGLTIITHGFAASGTWQTEMVKAIHSRVVGIPTYTVKIIRKGPFGTLGYMEVEVDQNNSSPVLDITADGGAVILIDWSGADAFAELVDVISTKEIAAVAFEYIFGKRHNNHFLAEIPIHLIGHSRGASVMAAIAYDLAYNGIWVDQLTTLDPHPIIGDWDYFIFSSMRIWNNVIFADNYRRTGGGLDVPDGQLLDGAFNTDLTGVLTDTEQAHTDVHTYYHGTIDLNAKLVDDIPPRTIQPSWYEILRLPMRQPRDQTGYYFSRYVQGSRDDTYDHLKGLHPALGVYGTTRIPPDALSDKAYPNVGMLPLKTYTYKVGATIPVSYYYQSAKTPLKISFYLDNDTNPYNSGDLRVIRNPETENSSTGIIKDKFDWNTLPSDAGTYAYIQAKAEATDGTGWVHYDYLFTPISINAESTAPDLTALSVTAPTQATTGETISVTFTVKNLGNGATGNFGNRISLATSAYGTDIRLGDFSMTSFAPNESRTETRYITIPASTSPGRYWITVYTDGPAPGSVNESNEGNNIGSTAPYQINIVSPTYLITASAGAGGSVSPSGSFTKAAGTDHAFTAIPSAGYTVGKWFVDGNVVQSGGIIYILSNIQANHSVQVTFENQPCIIRLEGDLNFGAVQVGGSVQQPMMIYNDGNSTLTVSSISYPPGFSGNWSGSIGAGSSSQVPVTFAPTEQKTYSGNVTVTSNATSGANTRPVSGSGTITSTRILRLAGNLSFGEVEVGGSANRTMTLYNDGNSTLTVSSLSYPADFSGNWSAIALAAGSSRQVTVTFSPTAIKAYSGYVIVSSDETSGANTLPASGTGIIPPTRIIRLEGDLNIGEVQVGYSARREMHIHNDGTSALTISSISYPAGFTGFNGSVALNAGGEMMVEVTFAPTEAKVFSGYVTVNSDATSGTNTKPVSGTGSGTLTRVIHIECRISDLESDLGFGDIQVGGSAQRPIIIYNNGSSTLTVSSISYPTGFSGNWSGIIAAGGLQQVTVTFSPGEAKAYSGYLTVNSDATSGINTYPLSGKGVTKATRVTPKIAAGYDYSLVLKTDGTVWGWGDNGSGQLGDGTNTRAWIPVPVNGLSGVIAIASGGWHTIALKSDGTVWAWGYNGEGALGDGTKTNRNTPVPVSSLSGVIAIAGGRYHTIALKSNGTVWAWGWNGWGQLGDGTNTNRYTPVQVSSLSGVIAIASGEYHTIALKSDGTVWAWGRNDSGQLGDGTNANRNTPVRVNSLSGVIAIAGGGGHTIALKSDGTVWTWGERVGNTPAQVSSLSDVIAIAGGASHTITLKSDGTVWAWGYNGYGQLGDGTNTDRDTPVQVSSLSGVFAIAGGGWHTLALKSDGTVWAWGKDDFGQLGQGYWANRNTPVLSVYVYMGEMAILPIVTSFQINNAVETTVTAVTLNNTATVSPTQYMASESSSFTNATWQTYAAAPSFTLSSGDGAKTVYFKVKNANGESVMVNDSIILKELTVVSTFQINDGASETTSRTVTLNNTTTGSPTHYMASESGSFTGAIWQTYAAAPGFTLSAGDGVKTVYFKVKDANGESAVVNDGITLKELPAVSTFQINNGASDTSIRTVTLNNTTTSSPTHYMASESPGFADALWLTYTAAPSFTLSTGDGEKTMYFKVKNANGESLVVNDSIALKELPVVSTFQINNGTAETTSRTVTLNNTATGSPTHYMASEFSNFADATWQPYAAAPFFTLSAGDGVKTVYFKVKNANGEPVMVNDSITFKELPVVIVFLINNGAGETTSPVVTLNSTAGGNPTHYMASESLNFTNATWQPYAAAPFFMLSAGDGVKTVYFKVKNANGESAAANDDITLKEIPVVSTFQINNGAAETTNRTVTLNNTTTGSPTHYMASESASFADATWLTYAVAPGFTLSAGDGVKTVYFKAKNANGESNVLSDVITLKDNLPAVTAFQINNGAAETTSRTVKLNNATTGSPTYYMASESASFTGASWRSYSVAPSFTLSTGGGMKAVYFKVKNAGGESNVLSDTITLKEDLPEVTVFQINNGAVDTTNRKVSLNSVATGSPTHYMSSESATFVSAKWKKYKKSIKFTLSASLGVKAVYFKVRNATGESSAVNDTITLKKALTATVADAGIDQMARKDSVVTLDGSKSFSPKENVPLAYQWSFVSLPSGMGNLLSDSKSVNPTFTLKRQGKCEIQLIVKDSMGTASEPDTVVISTQDTTPVAHAGSDQSIRGVGTRVLLNGAQSYDPDGDALTYQWSFISRPAESAAFLEGSDSARPTFVADVPGDYVIQLMVTDSQIHSSSATVTVSFGNVRPVANAGKSLAVKVGDTITLAGEGTDVNGDALNYHWILSSFPGGSLSEMADSSARVTTFTPDRAGVYVAQLVVSDGELDSEPCAIQIQAFTVQTKTIAALQELEKRIAELDSCAFKNDDMQNLLLNKLNAVIANVEAGKNKDAANQLRNDILPKMGSAENIEGDSAAWIIECSSQRIWYREAQDIVRALEMAR